MAIIKKIHDNFELPFDEICALFSDVNTLGLGNEEEVKDLFNRTFNETYASIDQKYIKGSRYLPKAYSDYDELKCYGDILSIENKNFKKRITKSLGISEKDLTEIVTRFREKAETQSTKMNALSIQSGMNLTDLSLLYRISKIAYILDTSVVEVLDTLELLEKDPFIRKYSNFNVLIHHQIETLNCFQIISGTDVHASMWLIQILFAVTKWMQENNFTASELQFIQTGKYKTEKVESIALKKKINSLNNLYQQFKPSILNAKYFQSELFDQRSSANHFEMC